MALTQHYFTQFEDNCFYHVYNRTVDKKPLFINEGNYAFFLKQYDHYISPIADTYAFCLLGNHFHLLIRILAIDHVKEQSNKENSSTHDIISHQFRKLFQSYAMAFNKQHDRTGTLFQTPFKRALVDSPQYFAHLISYIHANPQLHGLVSNYKDWRWSSFHRILIDKPSKLRKEEVISWFGNKELYKKFHEENRSYQEIKHIIFEDN